MVDAPGKLNITTSPLRNTINKIEKLRVRDFAVLK
jgi:hypothetical protein